MPPPPQGFTATAATTSTNTQSPQQPQPPPRKKTYLIIGASRGIGLEFCRQLLASQQRVIATARAATGAASRLWALTGTPNGRDLSILECDVADEESVGRFVAALGVEMGRAAAGRVLPPGVGVGGVSGLVGGLRGVGMGGRAGGGGGVKGVLDGQGDGVIDVCIVNAGVLVYPNRVLGINYSQFAHHLTTNTIGPLLTAAALLKSPSTSPYSTATSLPIPIRTLVFMSSDSGSAARFRAFEDGFAAYAASKAALNQGLRHLAAELPRLHPPTPDPYTLPAAFSSSSSSSSSSSYCAPATISPTPISSTTTPHHHHPHQEHPNARTVILALHPGEVATDMATAAATSAAAAGDASYASWNEVEGIISPEESVRGMLRVIADKGRGGRHERGGEPLGVASFWDWEGRAYPW